jgi:predicted transcriptional regulator
MKLSEAIEILTSTYQSLDTVALGLPVDAKEVESSSISTIQSLYRELKEIVDKKDFMIPLNEDGHSGAISIPSGITYNFAVLFEPKSQNTADELESSTVHREIQIRLLSVDTSDATKNVDTSSNQTQKVHEPIKPRILPIKAKVVRSEMTVLQKNISFGKTIVGEQSTRGVTIVNKSSVPCIYSISKSGSISSGFLKILSGRKGVVAPMSSHTLEFAFKPSLAGSFEETVHIENVLHPTNIQSIVVKAKVSKPESFQLSSVEVVPRVTSVFPDMAASSLIENQDLDLVQKLIEKNFSLADYFYL